MYNKSGKIYVVKHNPGSSGYNFCTCCKKVEVFHFLTQHLLNPLVLFVFTIFSFFMATFGHFKPMNTNYFNSLFFTL